MHTRLAACSICHLIDGSCVSFNHNVHHHTSYMPLPSCKLVSETFPMPSVVVATKGSFPRPLTFPNRSRDVMYTTPGTPARDPEMSGPESIDMPADGGP